MHHYFEAITNTSGDSLIGYFGQVIDPTTNNVVPIAADDNGTPIITVSGVANMAKTDAYGNLDFYVAPGTYHLNIYAPNSTSLQLQVKNVAMNSTKGDTGATGAQGDVGASDASFTTLAAMQAANPTAFPSPRLAAPSGADGGVNNGLFSYQLGNFTGRPDVVQVNGVPLTTGALVRQSVADLTVFNQSGGARRPAIHAYGQAVRLTQFGFKGDGTTDDTAAWRASIAYAGANKIRDIIVPPGISIVSGAITDASNPMPPGLRFVAEGACASAYSVETTLRYTGAGTCWGVSYPTGAFATVRGPSFDSMTFQTTNPAATVFDFNDTLTHTPYDNPATDPYRIIQGVSFRNCLAFGVNGTGDFIRACKVFELYIDHQTAIYSFRRGVWLKGCDNNEIRARLAGNNRGVMIEASGNYGNNNLYKGRSIQAADTSFGGENSYAIYDTGSMTTIGEGVLFESNAARAFMYIGGFGTKVLSPQFGTLAPMFEVGPLAREWTIYSPRVTAYNPGFAPIVNAPATWAFGDGQQDYRGTIIDAPYNIQRVLVGTNLLGRVRIVASGAHGLQVPQRTETVFSTTKGLLQSVSCSAANGGFWGYSGIGGQPIEGIVQDPLATSGYAIKISTANGSGFGLQFIIGVSLQPAQYRVSIRNRFSATVASNAFAFVASKNGSFYQALTFNLGTTYGRAAPDTLDLTGFVAGDTLNLELFNGNTGVSGWIDYVTLVPIAD